MIQKAQTSGQALAAYVVFKNFYDQEITSRDIIAKFIRYIFEKNHIRTFTLVQIEQYLREEFGFQIPEAVVKSALNAVRKEINISLDHEVYCVDNKTANPINNVDEEKIQHEIETINRLIVLLENYLKKQWVKNKFSRMQLIEELNCFMMDEESKNQDLSAKISAFILSLQEKSPEWYQQIASMRLGCILVNGLNYDLGSGKNNNDRLTLFLATEILFDVAGFNGKVWQNVAEDFFRLVKEYNRKEQHIILRYFDLTKQEVESYFHSAEMSLRNGSSGTNIKKAMRSILEGCKTPSDIVEKKTKFYMCMNQNGVRQDTFNYYAEGLETYNLETVKCESDDQKHLAYLSNINKLRRGRRSNDYIESRAILITGSRRAIQLSEENTPNKMVPLAMRMGNITRYLWHCLYKGFGAKMNLKWFEASIKAKIILSEVINHNIGDIYNKAKEDFQAGVISENEIHQRIVFLRKHDISPDTITKEEAETGIELSEETVNRYIEEQQLIEQELKNKCQEVTRKNQELSEKEQLIAAGEEKQNELRAIIKRNEDERRERERKDQKKKCYYNRIIEFVVVPIICLIISFFVAHYFNQEGQSIFGIFLAITPIAVAVTKHFIH